MRKYETPARGRGSLRNPSLDRHDCEDSDWRNQWGHCLQCAEAYGAYLYRQGWQLWEIEEELDVRPPDCCDSGCCPAFRPCPCCAEAVGA